MTPAWFCHPFSLPSSRDHSHLQDRRGALEGDRRRDKVRQECQDAGLSSCSTTATSFVRAPSIRMEQRECRAHRDRAADLETGSACQATDKDPKAKVSMPVSAWGAMKALMPRSRRPSSSGRKPFATQGCQGRTYDEFKERLEWAQGQFLLAHWTDTGNREEIKDTQGTFAAFPRRRSGTRTCIVTGRPSSAWCSRRPTDRALSERNRGRCQSCAVACSRSIGIERRRG